MNSPSCQSVCTQISNKMFTFPSFQAKKCSPALILVDVIKAIALTILFVFTIPLYYYHLRNKEVKPVQNSDGIRTPSPLSSSSPSAIPQATSHPPSRSDVLTSQTSPETISVNSHLSLSNTLPEYESIFWSNFKGISTQTLDPNRFLPTRDTDTNIMCTDLFRFLPINQSTRIGMLLHANQLNYSAFRCIAMASPTVILRSLNQKDQALSHPYFNELLTEFSKQDNPVLVDLREVKHCENDLFYPTDSQTISSEAASIKWITSQSHPEDNTTIYTYQITINNVKKTIQRFHFTGWPDHGVPTEFTKFNSLVERVSHLQGPNLWIHCNAGVGRTGTLATAIVLKTLILDRTIHRQNYVETLNRIILSFRDQRHDWMVMQPEQYQFVYNYGRNLYQRQQSA